MDFGSMMGGGGMGGGAAEAGAAIGGALGSWIGNNNAENDRRDIEGSLHALHQMYYGIRPYVNVRQEDAVNLGPSAYEGMGARLDAAPRQAQMQALRELMAVGGQGGMDPQSRVALAQAQQAAAQQQAAQQGLLRQSFQARGMGGGGAELAMRSAAGQQGANANAMAGMQAAADARTRALQALSQGAAIGGQVRGADYGQAADLANNRDRIADYNARNQQALRGRNVDRRIAAEQQEFDNRMAQAAGRERAYRYGMDWNEKEAGRKVAQGTATGSAVGRGIGQAVGMIAGGMG